MGLYHTKHLSAVTRTRKCECSRGNTAVYRGYGSGDVEAAPRATLLYICSSSLRSNMTYPLTCALDYGGYPGAVQTTLLWYSRIPRLEEIPLSVERSGLDCSCLPISGAVVVGLASSPIREMRFNHTCMYPSRGTQTHDCGCS